MTDSVAVSEHAASMGGSQVFLEPYETQDANTMIKCISIASANDASVAMAEHVAGSEEAFVVKMNQRAKELGMEHTNFVNCYGLDADNHYTCAMDVAIMSRELITRFPQVSNYSTVWMDTFVHTTKKGQTEFGLTNTNKLIKSYTGITGLKTGSTGLAKYCLSATARRDNMDLIAVIMAAPDPKTRFAEAAKLLNYGYANCSIFVDDGSDLEIPLVAVKKGVKEEVAGQLNQKFSYLCTKDVKPKDITKKVTMFESIKAPCKTTDVVGEISYFYNGSEIGKVNIYAIEAIDKAGYGDYFKNLVKEYF
jgi:D-alanyl-D-alanine carboxypeptidase (penicillin-binding protein 5/6)